MKNIATNFGNIPSLKYAAIFFYQSNEEKSYEKDYLSIITYLVHIFNSDLDSLREPTG
jgi:hypothetical protein